MSRSKKILFTLMGWGFGAGLGWLVLRGINWADAFDRIGRIDWSVAFLAMAAIVFSHYIKAYRWRALLQRDDISPGSLFIVNSAASGINSLSPVRIFSEVTQLTLVTKRHRVPAPRVLASILSQNLQDFTVTGTILGIGLLMLPQLAGYRTIIAVTWGVSMALFLGSPWVIRGLLRIPLVGKRGFLSDTLSSILHLQVNPRTAAAGIFLTVIAWMYIGIAGWLVAQAAGIDLPMWTIVVVLVAVTRLAGFIPSPPGGVGVFEFVAVSTLSLFAVDPVTALTFAVVIHAVIFLPPMLIAAVVLVLERSTFLSLIGSALSPMRHVRLPMARVKQAVE